MKENMSVICNKLTNVLMIILNLDKLHLIYKTVN